MKKLRILLVDDHAMVREGLRSLVETQPNMSVVGEAADGTEALNLTERLAPDIVVLDLTMPKMNGLHAAEELRKTKPPAKVLVLTAHEDESYLRELCKIGINGYLLKRSAGQELIKALLAVSRGELYFEPSLAAKALLRQVAAPGKKERSGENLSDREQKVLKLIAWGHSNKEIAGVLNLSVKTVETYKARIAQKAGLRSRTEMVQYALRQGWLNQEHPEI